LLALSRAKRSSWIGHLMFWGINLGLLVFVIGLIVDTVELKRIGAPVMGIVLLISLGILALGAWRTSDERLVENADGING
jgi:predicted membrane protein